MLITPVERCRGVRKPARETEQGSVKHHGQGTETMQKMVVQLHEDEQSMVTVKVRVSVI